MLKSKHEVTKVVCPVMHGRKSTECIQSPESPLQVRQLVALSKAINTSSTYTLINLIIHKIIAIGNIL